jgi:perosamine synthetase
LGVAQLEQLESYIVAKLRIAARYRAGLREIEGIDPMAEAAWARSTYWMYTVRVHEPGYGKTARGLLRQLQEQGIQTRPLWQPMHLSPAHRGCECVGGTVAEALYESMLSLPCSVGLSERDQDYVMEQIAKGFRMEAGEEDECMIDRN